MVGRSQPAGGCAELVRMKMHFVYMFLPLASCGGEAKCSNNSTHTHIFITLGYDGAALLQARACSEHGTAQRVEACARCVTRTEACECRGAGLPRSEGALPRRAGVLPRVQRRGGPRADACCQAGTRSFVLVPLLVVCRGRLVHACRVHAAFILPCACRLPTDGGRMLKSFAVATPSCWHSVGFVRALSGCDCAL